MKQILTLFLLTSFISCANTRDLLSGSATIGTLVGAGVGIVSGSIIGKETGIDKNRAITQLGVGAATLGLLVGAQASANKRNIERKTFKVRAPEPLSYYLNGEAEIHQLNKDIHNSSKWGQMEVLPWEKRYIIEDEEVPFQGYIY